MKILVTGGAGFIGSWVADTFINKRHKVLIVDDLSTGIEANIPKDAEFTKGNIREFALLEKVFSNFKPDIVNHHAAQINVRRSLEDPVFDAEVNIIGTLNLLELSVKHNIKRFVFASSGGAIYGEPENLPAWDAILVPFPQRPTSTLLFAPGGRRRHTHRPPDVPRHPV